ncbi:hypothetical protein FIBSPDRAFT_930720 [Athelia psychrophila]|uniref:C2 domain-containing protein n=1 Tax=Athelia psychrophila TaxID=1759441 RepID=A0A166LQ36_9AGAM|nr:hypothetical protein FIBSPDRAFT_930720 [Fibularhizoctonia sp. CBS 109695]
MWRHDSVKGEFRAGRYQGLLVPRSSPDQLRSTLSVFLRLNPEISCLYKELFEAIPAPKFTTAPMSPQSSPVAYTLQIISVNDLPPRRFKILGERRNVLVKATVEDRSVQTESRLCTSSPEWKETFQIEARETSSVLSLQLFDSAFRSTSMICASVITISDLLQLCRHGKDAELNLRDIKSRLKGRIRIHVSLSGNGSWIVDEAQRWALVLSQPPNTAMEATGGYIDDIDGLLAVSVPTVPPDAVSQSIVDVLDKLSHFMRIADEVAKVHPYAKLAWDVLSAAHKIIVAQVAIDQSVADLASTMQGTYSFVDALEAVPSKIPLLEDIIQRIFIQTVECAIFIREYSGHGFAVENQTLDKLGSSGVALARRSLCLPGTRRDIIDEIHEWALHPSKGDSSNVFCLHGVAGIGKSAVAATVATHLSEIGRLGAFIGFDQASAEKIQPSTAVTAIARQMAAHDGRLRASIIQVINDRTKDTVLDALLPDQFHSLIVKPLASIPALASEGPIVIVLDGLYECGQLDDWESLLEILVGPKTETLPSNLRFIITSRTVNGIHDADIGAVLHPHIKSRELRPSSHSEISAYFTFQMEQIRHKNKHLKEDWQGPDAIAELTSRAFGFFAWAVNAKTFVNAHCPPERLKSLLLQPRRSIPETTPALDELYKAALRSAGDWTDAHFVSDFRAIMGAILGSPVAISTTVIHRLLDRPLSPLSSPVMVTIGRLGSVLSHGPVIQVLHPSFLDFLSSRERCGCDNWYFADGPVRGSVELTTLCLQRMNAGLKRNMCNLTLAAHDHPTTEMLPEELECACRSWVDHICTSGRFESWEMEILIVFLHTHLLHWFEAMSLLKQSEEVVPMLQRVATWLEENTFEDKNLQNIVIEGIDFARKFAADIAEHPLYVYYVALPCCPSYSTLYQLFCDALSVDPSVLLLPLHGPVQISAETATLYLLIMNAGLKRNMVNMTLSVCLTREVLPEVLAYACQSWVDHVCTDGTFGSWAMEKLVVFLRTHLLHWFEAMSLLKKSEEIAPMLQRVATWLEENTFEDKSLKDLVIEAIDFAGKDIPGPCPRPSRRPVARIGPSKVVFEDASFGKNAYSLHQFGKTAVYKAIQMLIILEHVPPLCAKGYMHLIMPNHLAFIQPDIHGFTHGLVKEMSRPDTVAKFQAEPDASMPEPLAIPDIRVLQRLPYLNPLIQDGLRVQGAAPSPPERVIPSPPPKTMTPTSPSTSWTTHSHPAPSSPPRLGPCTRDPTAFPPALTFLPDPDRWLSAIEDQLAQMQAHFMPFRMGSWIRGNGARDDDDASPGTLGSMRRKGQMRRVWTRGIASPFPPLCPTFNHA